MVKAGLGRTVCFLAVVVVHCLAAAHPQELGRCTRHTALGA